MMGLMTTDHSFSRRGFLGVLAAGTLAGCSTTMPGGSAPMPARITRPIGPPSDAELQVMYGPVEDGGYLIPAIPYQQIDPQFYRQRVADRTGEAPGTVVVDTPSRLLYVIEPGGTAMRYGVGIGRDGFAWQGDGVIHWRQAWPRWKPPNEMVARQPSLAKYSIANGGMEPGAEKSARCPGALYLPERRRYALPAARQPGMEIDRQGGIVGLRAADEPGRDRPLPARSCKSQDRRLPVSP